MGEGEGEGRKVAAVWNFQKSGPFSSGVFSEVSGRISDSQDQEVPAGQQRARFQSVHELGTRMAYDGDSRTEHPAAPGLKSRATQTKPARSRLHPAAREGFVWVGGGFSLRGAHTVWRRAFFGLGLRMGLFGSPRTVYPPRRSMPSDRKGADVI